MIRASVVMIVLVVALGIPAAVTAAPEASIIAVSYKSGDQGISLVVAIPKGIDNAARNGNADFGLRATVIYVSVDGTIEILDSGRLSIKDTTFVVSIDKQTVAVSLQVPFGAAPRPGGSPSYTPTVELLHP